MSTGSQGPAVGDIANLNNGRRYLIGAALLLLFVTVSMFFPWFQFNDDHSLSVDFGALFTEVFLILSLSQPAVLLADKFFSKAVSFNSLKVFNMVHAGFVISALGVHLNVLGGELGTLIFLIVAMYIHPGFSVTLIGYVIDNTRKHRRSRRTELLISYCVVAINVIYYIDLFRQPFFI